MIQKKQYSYPFIIFITCISIIIAYYTSILLHEWSHGTLAWILGYYKTPFDIEYGGWLLLHVDEGVKYDHLLRNGQGPQAGLIAIAGYSINIVLFWTSIFLLSRDFIKNNLWLLNLIYWFSVFNMMAIWGYTPMQCFTVQGDIGRFVNGFNISPWFPFVIGTVFSALGIFMLLKHNISKLYVQLNLNLISQLIILIITLTILFLYFTLRNFADTPFIAIISYTDTWFKLSIFIALLILFYPLKKQFKNQQK